MDSHNRIYDRLSEVIDEAVDHGIDPSEFRHEILQRWSDSLQDKFRRDLEKLHSVFDRK